MSVDPGTLISADGWRRLAACVGQGPDGWQGREVAHPMQRDANVSVHVIPPSGGPGYLLKILRGDTVDRAAEQVAGHWAGMRRLGGHKTCRVPKLHGVAVEDDAVLMEYVPGQSLQHVLTADVAPEVRLTAVEVCARWLRTNAEAGAVQDLPLPVGTIRQRLHRLMRDAEAARGGIWQADAFDHLAALADQALAEMPERPMPTGARHGDANPGNFMFHPEGAVYGLDLLRPVPQHLAQDVAYLLARCLPHLPQAAQAQGLSQVCADLRAALQMEDDMAQATTLCLRIEVLGMWWRMPKQRFAAGKPNADFVQSLVEGDCLSDLRF